MESNYNEMIANLPQDSNEPEFNIDPVCGQLDELQGFRVRIQPDTEVERFYTEVEFDHPNAPVVKVPYWAFNDNPYFTLSGNTPVTNSIAHKNDEKRSAGGFSDLDNEWVPEYYGMGWKRQERNFHTVLRFIRKNKDNKPLLRKGWKTFWKRVYSFKAGLGQHRFLFSKQVSVLKKEFEACGISKRSK